MGMTVKTLEVIIEERAQKRLNEDFENLIISVKNSKFFNSKVFDKSFVSSPSTNSTENLRGSFWSVKSLLFQSLFEEYKNQYIEDETKDFLKEIEELKLRVQDLELDKEYPT